MNSSMDGTTIVTGLDLGDRYSYFCDLEQQQSSHDKVEEGRIRTTPVALRSRFGSCPPRRIAIEAGGSSPWVSRLLLECGHEVIVANPRRLRLIYEDTSKTDRLDAEKLARLARADRELLSPIQHRGARAQAHLSLLRSRDVLVKTRTELVNHTRGTVKSFGARIRSCSTESFHKVAAEQIPDELEPALSPILGQLELLTKTIRGMNREIEVYCENQYPETRVLRQIQGVGPLTSLCFVLTLEDPHKFKTSRSVRAFLGLACKKRSSGGKDPELRISKAGDETLRRLLVGAAHYILGPFGPETDLRIWGLKLAARGGKNAKKRAVVAVARKLAVLLHRLWLTGEVYEPLRNQKSTRKTA